MRSRAPRPAPRNPEQLAKSCGDDPDALFGAANCAITYRELRNDYVAAREPKLAALAAAKRALKEARITLAGGKVAWRREERRATTQRNRLLLRAQRRADEAAGVAAPAAKAKARAPAGKATPKAMPKAAPKPAQQRAAKPPPPPPRAAKATITTP